MTQAWYNTLHAWLLVWPRVLAADWSGPSVPLVESPGDARALAMCAAAACALCAAVCACRATATGSRRQQRVAAVALLCAAMTVLAFLPASGWLFPIGFVVAERVL